MPDTHDERGGDAQRYSAIDLDSWWSDAPMTDRQLDVLQSEIDNRLIPEGAHFHKQVVRKLAGEVKQLRAQLAAATAELGRVNRRTDFLDDALKGLRQQAIEAVKERNEAIARAEKAEAERRIATALSNRRKVERNQARALAETRREDVAAARRERDEAKAATANAEACLMLFVARFGSQTFHERDLKRAAEWLAAKVADAAQHGLSGTETGGEAFQGSADVSTPVRDQAAHPGTRLLGHAYITGWADAIAAYRAPGWTERETGWHQFRNALENDTAGPATRAEQEAGR